MRASYSAWGGTASSHLACVAFCWYEHIFLCSGPSYSNKVSGLWGHKWLYTILYHQNLAQCLEIIETFSLLLYFYSSLIKPLKQRWFHFQVLFYALVLVCDIKDSWPLALRSLVLRSCSIIIEKLSPWFLYADDHTRFNFFLFEISFSTSAMLSF